MTPGETNLTRNHEVVGSIPGPSQWVKDLALLWLWCRLAAIDPIRSLAWEPPYTVGVALKKKKKKKSISQSVPQGQGKSSPILIPYQQWLETLFWQISFSESHVMMEGSGGNRWEWEVTGIWNLISWALIGIILVHPHNHHKVRDFTPADYMRLRLEIAKWLPESRGHLKAGGFWAGGRQHPTPHSGDHSEAQKLETLSIGAWHCPINLVKSANQEHSMLGYTPQAWKPCAYPTSRNKIL